MKNILVIEDDERVSDVIKAYLEREGYNVHLAAKGMEGIEIARKGDINLIILDLMLRYKRRRSLQNYQREL